MRCRVVAVGSGPSPTMWRPALLQTWLLLAVLLTAVRPQQPPFSCDTEGHHVICHSGDRRVEFLDQKTTWREAHALCRRRRGFLVPSRAALDTTVLEELYQQAEAHGDFWLGARYLRNGYFEWLLQMYGELQCAAKKGKR